MDPIPFEEFRDSLQSVGVAAQVDAATAAAIQEAAGFDHLAVAAEREVANLVSTRTTAAKWSRAPAGLAPTGVCF